MVRRYLKIIILSLFAAVTVCCSSAKRFGVPLTSAQLYDCIKTFVDSTENRTVVLIPMDHVAKQSHYEKIKDYLDTLRIHGYVIFREGIVLSDRYTDTLDLPLVREVWDLYGPVDSMKLDTLSRKLRKVLGTNIESKYEIIEDRGHRVWDSSVLLPSADRDFWVDETYADYIKEFECRYGEIELSPYDFECPLDSDKYKGKKDQRWISIRGYSNNYCNTRLARCILESDFDKIAVVYGYNHIHNLFWFVLPKNGYKSVDNPYYK